MNVTFKDILLPVWISAYSYGGRSYRFVINAGAGDVQGERPYSAAKIVLLILTILLIAGIGAILGTWRHGM